jgi:hypothetical protein
MTLHYCLGLDHVTMVPLKAFESYIDTSTMKQARSGDNDAPVTVTRGGLSVELPQSQYLLVLGHNSTHKVDYALSWLLNTSIVTVG